MWLGIGETAKITLVAVGAFFPIYVALVSGIRGVDRKLIEVGRSFGISQLALIVRVLVPATFPQFLVGARIGLTQAWLFLVAAELLAASSGIGFLLTEWSADVAYRRDSRCDSALRRFAVNFPDSAMRFAERRVGQLGRYGARVSTLATRVRGISKAFGTQLVLDRFDLDVARGERVAILGASGCGKSTLLRCIAGLERADSGTITTAREVGLVFQEPRLFPWLDVEKNVAFGARTADERARVPGSARSRRARACSEDVAPKRCPAEWRSARRWRVRWYAIPTCCCSTSRSLHSMRCAGSSCVRRCGEILSFARASAILVTHDVDDALALADRVIVLAGSPAEIVFAGTIGKDASRETILAALGVAATESERGDRFVRQEARLG